MNLGLALSGGGFRATLFHLGVVKALLDRGVLSGETRITHITSVSGGSILAAHLVQNWRQYTNPSTFEVAARKIIDFARADIRGRVFRRLLLPPYLLLPYLENLRNWPPRLRRDGTIRNLLFERDLRGLFGDQLLKDLVANNPDAPRLDILTTNLSQGSLAYFSNGTLVPSDEHPTEIETPISVARAVMASALFPGVFPTVELNAENLVVNAEKFPSAQYFTDGGVYDNLGIRRFQTVLGQAESTIEQVLVSDASGAFDWLVGTETLGPWKTALRSSEVFMKRLADLECELAGGRTSDRFTFLRISDVVEGAELPDGVQEQIRNIRTDLDRFSTQEIRALVLHGYAVAARATEGWTSVPSSAMVPWDPYPSAKEPEARAIQRLRRSRFHPFGLFYRRDWAGYVYPLLFVIALGFFARWYDGERMHWHYEKHSAVPGTVPERVLDADESLARVQSAVKRPHSNPQYRLEAALLAYALTLQEPKIDPPRVKALLDKALMNLDPGRTQLFHEAKWKHFYSRLEGTSFGYPLIRDDEGALQFIEDAVTHLRSGSPSQVEAAITSYGVHAKDQQTDSFKRRAFDLLGRALERMGTADEMSRLGEADRFRATLIKGHYSLANGNTASNKGDAFFAEGARAQAAEQYRQAEQEYQTAARTYVEASGIRFAELWKTEYNLCNASLGSASATENYVRTREPLPPQEREQFDEIIKQSLERALKSCQQASALAPPTRWGPDYGLGVAATQLGQRDAAVRAFLDGLSKAERAGERNDYLGRLGQRQDVRSLCRITSFSTVFVTVCRE